MSIRRMKLTQKEKLIPSRWGPSTHRPFAGPCPLLGKGAPPRAGDAHQIGGPESRSRCGGCPPGTLPVPCDLGVGGRCHGEAGLSYSLRQPGSSSPSPSSLVSSRITRTACGQSRVPGPQTYCIQICSEAQESLSLKSSSSSS